MKKRSHDVTIVTTDFEFDAIYAKSLNGIDVIPFKCEVNLGSFLFSPKLNGWLHNNIRSFDAIHLNNFRSYQNNQIHSYASRYDIPYILQARGSLPRLQEKEKLKKLYDLVWGKSILQDASKVIALNAIEAQQYKEFGVRSSRIEIIPNGLDLSEYQNLPPKGLFRDKYGLGLNDKMVLFLGRIHKIKGIDLLIDVLPDLTKEFKDLKLVIAGPDDGSLADIIKRVKKLNVGNNVLFTGPLYNIDKLSAYVDADIFVLPSIYEIFGNTILEAWACGTPVIVTDRCGISNIVQDTGISIKYDKNQLKSAISILLNDESLRMELANKGKALVRNVFDNNKIIGYWEYIFDELERKW